MKVKLFISLTIVVLLYGCAPFPPVKHTPTEAESTRNRLIANRQTASEIYTSCLTRNLYNSPEYARLNKKYIFYPNDTSALVKTIIKDKASDSDISDMISATNNTSFCNQNLISDLRNVHQKLSVNFQNYMTILNDNKSKVLAREITIGEYNRNFIAIINKMSEADSNILQEIDNDLARQHRTEITNRREAAIEFYEAQRQTNNRILENQQRRIEDQYRNTQEFYNQQRNQNRTTHTNCYFIGNTLHCDSNSY